jgi:hypothetical protein
VKRFGFNKEKTKKIYSKRRKNRGRERRKRYESWK